MPKENKFISPISDISPKKNSLPVISLKQNDLYATYQQKVRKEKEKLLAYQRKIQSQPRVIDLRENKKTVRVLRQDFVVKITPASSRLTYLPKFKKVRNDYGPTVDLRKKYVKLTKKVNEEKRKLVSFSKLKKLPSSFVFQWSLARKTVPFLMVAALCVFSIKSLAAVDDVLNLKKDKILGEVNVASQYLNSGKNSLFASDFQIASYKFKIAGERFNAARHQINFLEKSLANVLRFLPNREISSSLNLLEAGGNISFAAESLSSAFLRFQNTQDIFALFKNNQQNQKDKIPFTAALIDSSRDLSLANFRLLLAKKNLDRVDPTSLPSNFQKEVEEIKKTVPQLQNTISYFLKHLDLFLEILGHNQPKKYIVFFENSREMRPSGGFLGTYGLLEINEGRIENFKIHSPYVISGQLKEKYKAPEPLRLIQSRFNFHDANWFFDFPTSARKISLFHEKAGFPTVDGVFVITSNMMPDILQITGPIPMPEYNTEINAENFYEVLQREAEINYDKKLNEPKKIIADLFPKLFERISNLDKNGQREILQIILRELLAKNILLYFRDEQLEKMVQDFGFAGEVKETSGDYLAVVSTNIGGGKTDHVIKSKVELKTEILPEGKVINTLTISRSHKGELRDFWTSIKNMNFLRIYVPQGSKLIFADGFDAQFFNPDILVPYDEDSISEPDLEAIEKTMQIHEPSKTRVFQEGTKTVFGNWQGLEVGQSKTVVLKYELPYEIKLTGSEPSLARYSLLVQKQPGMQPFNFISELYFPQNFSIISKYTQDKSSFYSSGNMIHYEAELSHDLSYGVVFGKKEEK